MIHSLLNKCIYRSIFSLVIYSILFWGCGAEHEADITSPVDYRTLPHNLIITGHPLKSIDLHFSGSKSMIMTLSARDLTYVPDLTAAIAGVVSIKINKKDISTPKGVLLREIKPAHFALHVENKIEKKLPLKVSISGKPAPGFMVEKIYVEPSSVILSGPESLLLNMERVLTLPVDIGAFSETFKKKIPLNIPGGVEIVSPVKIFLAEVSIKEKSVTKKFAHLPLKGKNTKLPYSISPDILEIEVEGPENILKNMTPGNDFDIFIDLAGLGPGEHLKRASIILPFSTRLLKVKPEFFKVKILKNTGLK